MLRVVLTRLDLSKVEGPRAITRKLWPLWQQPLRSGTLDQRAARDGSLGPGLSLEYVWYRTSALNLW